MKAADAAMAALSRIYGVDDYATTHATRTLHGLGSSATFRATKADHDLADLLGIDGCRAQFLGAVDLVGHFDQQPWDHDEALDALASFWGRDVATLSAVEWIISATYADRVRQQADSLGQGEAENRTYVVGSGSECRRGESGPGIDLASS